MKTSFLPYGIIVSWIKKYEKFPQYLGVALKQIDTVLSLTAEGATIPFYRPLSERYDRKSR